MPSPRRDDDLRRLFRVMNRHGISLMVDIGAGVGLFGQALRAAGYRGRIISFEPGIHAHRRLSEAAQKDPLWQVAPRAQVCDYNLTGLLPLSAASTAQMVDEPDLGDEMVIGEEPVDCVRLDMVLNRLGVPADEILVAVENAGEETAVLDGAGSWLERVKAWQLELPLLPLKPGPISAGGPAPYLETIALMDKKGFEPVLFGPGYFSIHVSRLVQMTGVFIRRDALAPIADSGATAEASGTSETSNSTQTDTQEMQNGW